MNDLLFSQFFFFFFSFFLAYIVAILNWFLCALRLCLNLIKDNATVFTKIWQLTKTSSILFIIIFIHHFLLTLEHCRPADSNPNYTSFLVLINSYDTLWISHNHHVWITSINKRFWVHKVYQTWQAFFFFFFFFF